MPLIKLQHVVSVSSEDKNYEAQNLLLEGKYKKWKCASGGQKQASVVLQFEKACKIRAIDIGNEGSAFVEVLVGRLSDSEQNYQVLLIASSFMTPLESRNGTNLNRVRMFTTDNFTKGIADEKWDRVKIVCTQPFNKTAQYGIAFVKFHSYDSEQQPPTETETPSQIGAFKLIDDSDAQPRIAPGSLFLKRKDTKEAMKGALEIRAASAKAEADILSASVKTPVKASEAVKRKLEVDTTVKESKKATNSRSELPSVSPDTDKGVQRAKGDTASAAEHNSAKTSRWQVGASPSQQPPLTNKDSTSRAQTVPLHKLMSGVTFALSGFQNPLRGELREKAIEMGAKYKPDWDDSCTHLVCAFPNTPKYQQVKSKSGKIVSKQWILDCYKSKVAASWRKYKLKSKKESTSSETDDDEQVATKPKAVALKGSTPKPASAEKENSRKRKTPEKASNDEDDYGGSTDVDSVSSDNKERDTNDDNDDTEYDTDEEIRRVMKNRGDVSPLPDTCNMPLPDLPDYFHGSKFFLYSDFDPDEKRTLMRLIVAFNGKVEDYMNSNVAYVITKADWDDQFDEALTANSGVVFVKPKWIYMCAKKHKALPHQPYVIVPTD